MKFIIGAVIIASLVYVGYAVKEDRNNPYTYAVEYAESCAQRKDQLIQILESESPSGGIRLLWSDYDFWYNRWEEGTLIQMKNVINAGGRNKTLDAIIEYADACLNEAKAQGSLPTKYIDK